MLDKNIYLFCYQIFVLIRTYTEISKFQIKYCFLALSHLRDELMNSKINNNEN